MNLVSPPSTNSSYTRSASSSPDRGRATAAFSIFIPTAARSTIASSRGSSPVRGQVIGSSLPMIGSSSTPPRSTKKMPAARTTTPPPIAAIFWFLDTRQLLMARLLTGSKVPATPRLMGARSRREDALGSPRAAGWTLTCSTGYRSNRRERVVQRAKLSRRRVSPVAIAAGLRDPRWRPSVVLGGCATGHRPRTRGVGACRSAMRPSGSPRSSPAGTS